MDFLRILRRKNMAEEQTRQQQVKENNWLEVLRALSSYSRLIILSGVVLIVGLWLLVYYQINNDYDRTIEEASRETMNLCQAFEEHVRRIVTDADVDLLNLKQAYEHDGISSPVITAYTENQRNDPPRNQVAIYNEQGFIIQSFIKGLPQANYSDRAYFQVHRDSAADRLFIGPPIQLKASGRTAIPLSRRINKPDGSFAGVVYIGLIPEYFRSFYNKMDLGQDQVIVLVGTDWFVRARQSGDNVEVGQNIAGSMLRRNVEAGRAYGSYITSSVVDGIQRFISYRVMPDYPLILVVGKSMQAALAEFEQRKRGYILGAALVSVLILAFCIMLVNRVGKLQAFNEELQRSHDKLAEQAKLLNSAHDYIMVRDLDNRIIYWNSGAEGGYGYRADEAKGRITYDLLRTQFPINCKDNMGEIFTKGRWKGELIHTCKNGEKIIVQSSQTLNRDAMGNPVSILEINHDITYRKKLEDELSRLDRFNVIGEMAAGIGHEVRNPMTTVRGYLQMFQRKEKFTEYHEQIITMIEELDRANSIITEFLSLAKNKAVEMKFGNLNHMIHTLLPLIQADALRSGHEVVADTGDIPDSVFDEKEIRQLILNLVRNGLEAMQQSGVVTIRTYVDNAQLILSVTDTGSGIPQEVLDNLGTPFMTTKDTGTGLGLPICYRVADRHGAKIDVSTGSTGTTFTIRFTPSLKVN